MPASARPVKVLVISAFWAFSSPRTWAIRALAMIKVSPSRLNSTYSASGFTHRPTLLGSVQGVVVQARK